jgi:hypothetical protein
MVIIDLEIDRLSSQSVAGRHISPPRLSNQQVCCPNDSRIIQVCRGARPPRAGS